jgi:arginyl-tRNA synthetase
LPDEEKQSIAHVIAVGALRYFLLKWTRNSLIVFDFQEALSFKGETGPYCQYAAVRANSIFRNLQEGELESAEKTIGSALRDDENRAELARVFEGERGDELWSLVALAGRLGEVLAQSAAAAEPSHLAKYAFQLARAFNFFYHHDDNRIVAETNPVRRAVLIRIADYVRRRLTSALATLGIEVPERM